jgi:hypothetical protein
LEPTQPPTRWITRFISSMIKRPGSEANLSPLTATEVKNFSICLYEVQRNAFIFVCTFIGLCRNMRIYHCLNQGGMWRDATLYSSAFRRFRKNFEKGRLASSCPSVLPSIGMEQLGSHWTDFHEILYLRIFRNTLRKIQVSLKSNQNNRYFTRRPLDILDHISLISFYNEKCFRQNLCRKSKHILCWVTFFENRAVCEIMWKNIV